jgi:hypothetical protein
MKKPDLRTFAQWLDPYLVAELESRRRLKKEWHRRRLVTSLLDPILFPASELARIYHMRWDIETFYRDYKHTLGATS